MLLKLPIMFYEQCSKIKPIIMSNMNYVYMLSVNNLMDQSSDFSAYL